MTITEDLREKARGLGGKRGFSCSKYLADEFGIECGELSCGDCYACLFERIADRIDDELDELDELRDENLRLAEARVPQLPEGVEWPRFEDGELVGIGDEVEHGDKVWEVDAICFDRKEWSMALSRNLDISRMSGSYDERLKRPKRPKPKALDADGAPIEVGDTVYFVGGSGTRFAVKDIDFKPDGAFVDIIDEDRYSSTVNPESLTHERPDSWERLEADAAKEACEYAGARKNPADPDRYTCIECPYHVLSPCTFAGCNKQMRLDIMRRAKALAKAGEGE